MIKEFAEYKTKFKRDDYIFYHDKDSNTAKISKIYNVGWEDYIYYQIMNDEGYYNWISKKLAFRKATPEEIKDFKVKLTANKYNL